MLLVLLSVLPALLVIVHTSFSHSIDLERDVTDRSISLIHSVAAKQRSATESAKQLLTTIARLPSVRDNKAQSLNTFFSELIKQGQGFANIVAMDKSGLVYASGLPFVGPIVAKDRKFFKDAVRFKRFSVGEFTVSRSTNRPAIHFALPVMTPNNEIDLVLVAVLDIQALHDVFSSLLENIGAKIVVTDHKGIIIYTSDGLDLKTGNSDPFAPHLTAASYQTDSARRLKSADSQDYLLATSSLTLDGEHEPYMYFRASFDLTKLSSEEHRYLLDSLGILALATSLALLAAWFLGNALIGRRLQRLVRAAQRIARGDLTYRVGHTIHGAEFRSLAQAFDEMAASLEARERENEKYEEELHRSARLESLGILAGGIAHDFNNLLMALSGNLSLLKFSLAGKVESEKILKGMGVALGRAKDLTLQLLTFSKGGKPLKKLASIEEVVRSSAEFVLRGSPHDVKIVIANTLSTIEIDEGQISQVVSNLVINALQAMEKSGIITITLEELSVSSVDYRSGKFIKVSVADQGHGIAKEQLAKVFEPFFTTKVSGHGLGLTSSHSIIKNHGGWMEAESVYGTGSTFSFFLPLGSYDMQLQSEQAEVVPMGQKRKILVMDDDPMLRELMSRMIQSLSHEVTVCANGEEAIELVRESFKMNLPFDAVILDLTIRAGLGGKETVARLRTEFPSIRGIAVSGFATDDILANFQAYGFAGRLSKPFKIEELHQVIETVCTSKGDLPSAIAS